MIMIFEISKSKVQNFQDMDVTLKYIYTKHFYLCQNVHLITPK